MKPDSKMPVQKSPAPPVEKRVTDKIEDRDGKQVDDNIDDLGRDVNDPNKKPMEQPTGNTKA